MEAASAAAAAAASAVDFGSTNESGGIADSAPKTRGGAIGGRGVLDDAVPESGGVRPAGFSSDSAPDESMFEGADAEADDGCSAGDTRALSGPRGQSATSARSRRADRLVLDDEYLRRLVLGSRRELATNDLGDRECRVVGAYVVGGRTRSLRVDQNSRASARVRPRGTR